MLDPEGVGFVELDYNVGLHMHELYIGLKDHDWGRSLFRLAIMASLLMTQAGGQVVGASEIGPQFFLVFGDHNRDGLRNNGETPELGVEICAQQPPQGGAISCGVSNENGSVGIPLQYSEPYSASLGSNSDFVPTVPMPFESIAGPIDVPEVGVIRQYRVWIPLVIEKD